MTARDETSDTPDSDTREDGPLDPLSDFSIPGDTDLHVAGDASGADGREVAEPSEDE
ncbi:hypothetical protein GTU73_08170 [Rathayibacter sp. VKM Ac-2804]|jgi:hypothetical protein|uniref:hypothetical protein n=1 Tax=unclassified Rathayibacter TaxID=2609250 RepID=UPI00132F2AB4|nr:MULTISPECIES: hypothetical protein [unclassified Rathayibacter]NRG39732.1 hypothetical protein [Rathayibacter sp. VKM Ac-2835]QHF23986.1 hypothetical protein GTU73_08170 [Rathayibacter sp. VKM Ac-2804]